MNSTKWNSLTEFISYLHESNKLEAEFTELGMFITYTDKVLKEMKEQKEEQKRLKIQLKNEQIEQ